MRLTSVIPAAAVIGLAVAMPFAALGATTTMVSNPGQRFIGSPIADKWVGSRLDDRASGMAGSDRLNGVAGNDAINGGDGNDWIWGGFGNDTLTGGMGADRMSGGAGDDRIRSSELDGKVDIISCGPGMDSVTIRMGDKARADCERVKLVM